jgi:2',3'-cyclic-nucleotide 2'-phosphodiesterase (5'-nucleotidase family)
MPSPSARPTLRIVSVNDVYALDNLPRLATLVRRHRAGAEGDTIVTLAGDFVAPSVLSSLDAGRGMVLAMRAVGVTHATLGNHEDDIPTDELRKRIAELGATFLTTNVRGLDPTLPASSIVLVGPAENRVKIGLIGVVTVDETMYRRAPFGGGPLLPPNAAALAETARLFEREKCDAVIPLTHQSFTEDVELARAAAMRAASGFGGSASGAARPYPVIVGGHEHVVFLEQVSGTWILKAGSEASHAVVTDLVWSAGKGAPPEVTVRLENVIDFPEDPAVRALVDEHMQLVVALGTATLLKLPKGTSLSSVGTRVRQTSLGALLCSRVRDALGAHACLFNGGGIRAARDYKDHFTYGDLEAEVPFDNEVVVARLPGRVVADAVRASRAHAPAEYGGFLQVDDHTVVAADGTALRIAGAPFDPGRVYRVAIVRELFTGLDHIEPLVRFARENPTRVPESGSGRGIKLVLVEAFSIALWKELGGFDAVDANHDGTVTASEVALAVARATEEAPSSMTADLVLRALHADKSHGASREDVERATRGPDTPPDETE